MTDRSQPVIIEQSFDASTDRMWRAITDRDEMIQWYFEDIPAFSAVVGFETGFNVKAPSRDFYHQWKVTDVIPGKRIAYEWTFKDVEGAGSVVFEVEAKENGALLRLTNTGLDTYPAAYPEFTYESCRDGWRYFIQQRLVRYIKDSSKS